ncbi:MAG TPA: tripartite tricarboxylate transporter substrate-binding protein, partial [Vicinamibacterales bacterium]
LLLALLLAGCSGQARFPDGPLLLICPWAAGGGSDRVARQVAALLEQDLGVPVNVVNATGGDGVTGHSRGALARPDGYTLTLLTVEIASLHWRGMTNVAPDDFAPLALVNRDAAAVFVRTDAPWQTLKELENAIRTSPGSLRASGTATAGIWHLALAGWLTQAGLRPTDVIWVSIAGAAPSLQELLAGGVDLVSCSLPEAQALLRAGRIRSLGIMADERSPQFPDVPTFAEQGVNWSMSTIRGIGVPAGTPPDRQRVLAEALERVVKSQAYADAMLASGFTPAYEDPARFAATLRQTDERLGALLRSEAFAGLASKQVGPMFVPSILAILLVATLIGLAIGKLRSAHKALSPAAAAAPLPRGAIWRFAEVLIGIAIYILLADRLGFVITAGVLLAVHLLRLGTRPIVALPLTVGLVPLVYQVFAVLLRVPLPRGYLGW